MEIKGFLVSFTDDLTKEEGYHKIPNIKNK
jgi:hypothetical protein